jgi:hypothetical protein
MKPNKSYCYFTLLFSLLMPVLSMVIDKYFFCQDYTVLQLIGKWFVFWAIGLRLLLAGFKQTVNPAFTLERIFHIKSKDCLVVVRELGFSNSCFGLLGTLSIFSEQFRLPAAIAGGLYLGLSGGLHVVKRPASTNETIAMVSDIFTFSVLFLFVLSCLF